MSHALQPYDGRSLVSPRVAVIFRDSVGDFAVATVMLNALRERCQDCQIDYFGGARTADLESASALIDNRYSLFGGEGLPSPCTEPRGHAYDLAVNMEAAPVAALAVTQLAPRFVVGRYFTPNLRELVASYEAPIDGLHRENWTDPTLLKRYPELKSTHISEIWCRLSRVEPTTDLRPILPCVTPSIEIPDVLIATGATRSAKIWPLDCWRQVAAALRDSQARVGLIGASESEQWDVYHCGALEATLLSEFPLVDLRARLSLPEVVGAIAGARLCVTLDNGIMHLAAGTTTPTVAIFGGSAVKVWAAPVDNLRVVQPPAHSRCSLCAENWFRNKDCLLDEHRCMTSVEPDAVLEWIDFYLR